MRTLLKAVLILAFLATLPVCATTLTLAASPNPSTFGSPVTLTATADTTAATGTVTFYDGTSILGVAPMVSGTASFSTPGLPPGRRSLLARYSGDPTHAAAWSSAVAMTVTARADYTIASLSTIPVFSGPRNIIAADFNKDGKIDLAIAGAHSQNEPGGVTILLGKGKGEFQSPVTYPASTGAYDVATGDFNGDGNPDLVVAIMGFGINSIAVMMGNGDGSFGSPVLYPAGAGPYAVRVADFNRDGIADVAAADVGGGVSVLLGNGNGSFQTARWFAAGTAVESLAIADFNGDGFADIVTANASSNSISVLLGDGNGGFFATFHTAVPGSPIFVAAADFNNDGKIDVAVSVMGYAVEVMLGNGDGTFQTAVPACCLSPVGIAVTDFNADGIPDLAVANQDGSLIVTNGSGDGRFVSPYPTVTLGSYLWLAAAGDFNGDGAPDLAVISGADSTVALVAGIGTITSSGGGQGVLVGSPFAAPLSVTVLDAVGAPVAGVTVTFTPPASGAAAVLSAQSAITNSAGVASVAATANSTPGLYEVWYFVAGQSRAFVLENKPPALFLSPPSQSTTVGTNFPSLLQVTVRDPGGNLAAGVTVNFSAPATGPSAILSRTTAVTDASGTVSALATANAIGGIYSIGVSVPSLGLSGSFRMTNRVSSSVTLAAPPTAVIGAPVTLTATISPAGATGQVAFYDGVILLGTKSLSSGAASLSTISLSPGVRRFSARYAGDALTLPAVSNTVVETAGALSQLGFATVASTTLQNFPDASAVADLNGDGKADLIVAVSSSDSVAVLLGNGNGTFRPEADYFVPGASWVGVADFNRDGIPDLAVARSQNDTYNSSHFYILLGNGDGTFQSATGFFVAGNGYPGYMAIGDFNGDGTADIVLVSSWANRAAVFLGNGDGTFQAEVDYPVPSANAVVVGDFDGDGKADLAVAAYRVGVYILRGNGDGTFQPAVFYASGQASYYLAAADFNGDGKLDLLTGEIGSTMSVLVGNGDGTFLAPLVFTVGGTTTTQIGVGDFNGDGIPDLAFGSNTTKVVTILFGNGNGTFRSGLVYTAPCSVPIGAVSGEFTGDGRTDLIVASGCPAPNQQSGTYSSFALTMLAGVSAPARVNAGGTSYADSLGQAWSSDMGYLQGSITTTAAAIAGTNDPALYRTQRTAAGTLSYQYVVPNGNYIVNLKFAEFVATSAGQRVFDVVINGSTVRSHLDIFAAAGGRNAAYDTSFPVTVANNLLAITLTPVAGAPVVNGIEILPAGALFAALRVSASHAGNAAPGQSGFVYTLVVSNVGAGPTGGMVTVTETLPDGVTLVSMSGDGWTCPPRGDACTRSDALAPGARYPDVAVTVNVAANAAPSLTNSVTVSGGGSGSATATDWATVVAPSGLRFVPLTPCRIADTRNAAGPFGGPQIAGGATRSFAIPSSDCGVPANAYAYSLNVAVVPSGPLGYLTVWRAGEAQPVASTLNSLDGRIKSNAAIVPAGAGGAISVFASNATDVILDINGYFVPATDPAGLAFYPITPCRAADTRSGQSLAGGQRRTFAIQAAASCNIPPTAQAYSLNFAAAPKGPLGYITAWATGQAQTLVASLNALTGTVTANAAIVPAGTDGSIDVFASNPTDLVIDINGYFAPMTTGGLSLYTVTPCRVLDTRQPAGTASLSGASLVAVADSGCGAPATAQAHVLSATVVPPAALGYLTLWPQGLPRPNVATLNALDGMVTSNLAIVPTTSGSISVFPSNPTHLVLDIFGYFAQ